jgi:hypothetical protein
MAVECNIASTFGATTPTGGYTNESSRGKTLEKAFVLDEDGVKVKLRAKKLHIANVQISGKGSADYAVVTAGDFTAGTFKATQAETTEYNDGEYIDFSLQGQILSSPS